MLHGAIGRRTFIGFGAGAFAGAGALSAQPGMPVVGVLIHGPVESFQPRLVEALRRLGYETDKNIRFEVRSGQGDAGKLPGLANELVQARVDLIVARLTPAVLAASRATEVIPVVMAGAGDPVGNGLIESLARPGRNVTGVAGVAGHLAGKLVELARDMVPNMHEIMVLANPSDVFTPIYVAGIERTGRALGIRTPVSMIQDTAALATVFGRLRAGAARPQSVIVQPSLPRRSAAAFALAERLPSFSPAASFADEGGLMGYSSNEDELFEQTATYVDKIIKGAVPAVLPASQPTKFDLVINMRTAGAIGLAVPPTMQALASSLVE